MVVKAEAKSVNYDHNRITVQASVTTIVNYNYNMFIVEATGFQTLTYPIKLFRLPIVTCGQHYNTFYGRKLRLFIISYSVCPCQAFTAYSNVCG
jgi:hypothetical protein